MTENGPDSKRILDCAEGLLYFYGVIDLENLHREAASRQIDLPGHRQFQSILDEALAREDSSRELYFEDGLYCHKDVDDPRWLLEEQARRAGISYRPVSEREVRAVVKKEYPSLWHPSANMLSEQLQEQFGWSREETVRRISFAQLLLRNGVPHMQLVELFLEDIDYGTFEALQPVADMISDLARHTPQWILKGWTSQEILEQRSALQPAVPEEGPLLTAGPAADRSEPCPCGSGKAYKQCCGAPAGKR